MDFITLHCDMFKLVYIILLITKKLVTVSSVNSTCFIPCGPSSGTGVHDLKHK